MNRSLQLSAGERVTIELGDSGIFLARRGQRVEITPQDLAELAAALGARDAPHGGLVLLADVSGDVELTDERLELAGADKDSIAFHRAAKEEIELAKAEGSTITYLEAARRIESARAAGAKAR